MSEPEERPMSREEWLEFHADQAPEITEEQWRETVSILHLTRRRRHASGKSLVAGEASGTGAFGAGGRDAEPPAA